MNPASTNTRISVIIPTYKRGDIFYQCLESVVNSISNQDEIIVVNDDKSASISVDEVDLKGKKVTILNNPKQGVASARNYGAAHSKGDVLLFVDDDMIINQEAVLNAFRFIQENSQSIVNANWVYSEKDVERLQNTSFGRYLIKIGFHSLEGWCNGQVWRANSFMKVNGLTSQFMMMNKRTFETIGGYDEGFPFAGFEDAALGEKVRLKEIRCYIDTTSLIYHNEIDRMSLLPYLERKKRGALTRKVGCELGYGSFVIHYSFFKKIYYKVLVVMKPFVLFCLNNVPNHKACDWVYNLLLNRLVGTYIYEGYFKIKVGESY